MSGNKIINISLNAILNDSITAKPATFISSITNILISLSSFKSDSQIKMNVKK